MVDTQRKAAIEESINIIKEIGGRGTPSFLINGKLHVGWGSSGGLKGSILRELKKTEQITAQGLSARQAYLERLKANLNTTGKDKTIIDRAVKFFF